MSTNQFDRCSPNEKFLIHGDLGCLISQGFDVTIGTRKAPGDSGYYVSLEHVALDEPQEFAGQSLAQLTSAARGWARDNWRRWEVPDGG